MSTTLTTLALAFLLAASASAQTVYVVAPMPGPGVFSTDIQPAIDAAVDGDLVLVKSGSYSGFNITAKGISVVADAGASVVANGLVFISNISATQFVLLQGLTTHGDTTSPAIILLNAPGPIWIESCNVTGGVRNASGLVGVQISTCPSVVIERSVMTGGSGAAGGTTDQGAPGLHVANSTVTVGDSLCIGGNGAPTLVLGPNAGFGAAGLRVLAASTVFASGTTFKGGNGAPPAPPNFPGGGAGSGINTSGAVTVLECTSTSGHTGNPNFPAPPPIVILGGVPPRRCRGSRDISRPRRRCGKARRRRSPWAAHLAKSWASSTRRRPGPRDDASVPGGARALVRERRRLRARHDPGGRHALHAARCADPSADAAVDGLLVPVGVVRRVAHLRRARPGVGGRRARLDALAGRRTPMASFFSVVFATS